MAKGFKNEGLKVKVEAIPGLTPRGIVIEEGLRFQCPPLEEFSVDYAFAHTDYDTARKGQFSRKGGRQLIQTAFQTLAVDYGSYTVLTLDDDEKWIEKFSESMRDILESGAPVLLTAAHDIPRSYDNWNQTEAGPELQMPATLRTLKITERAGEPDARYFDVGFTEYRDPVIGTRSKSRGGAGKGLPVTGWISTTPGIASGVFQYRPSKKKKGPVTTVYGRVPTFGDSVPGAVSCADLARHFYGDASLASHIVKANKMGKWGASTPIIKNRRWGSKPESNPGKFVIPRKPSKK